MFIECLTVDTLIGGGSTTTLVGTPTPPRVFGPEVGILTTDLIADGLNKLEEKLVLLFPSTSPNLSTLTLSLTNTIYNAHRSSGLGPLILNTSVQNDSLGRPLSNNIGPFHDGNAGVLNALIKSSAGPATNQGSITITTGNNTGTNGALTIVSDTDVVVPSGFYKSLVANIKVTSGLTASNSVKYSYQMNHSLTGTTNLLEFYQDDSVTPTVTGQSITSYSGATGYVSGVATISNVTNTIEVTFSVQNAVKTHFHEISTGKIEGLEIVTDEELPGAGFRTIGATPIFNFSAVPLPNVYNENLKIVCIGRSSAGQTDSEDAYSGLGPIRIDTVSLAMNEGTLRVTSGSGDYPLVGYNMAYTVTDSLLTNEEAQLINGKFQYPALVDYTTSVPVGPDYSGIVDAYRWVTFNFGVQNLTLINLTIVNGVGFVGGIENWKLQVILLGGSGPTKWVDGNYPYPGVGSPGAGLTTGDPALVLVDSLPATKTIAFGPVYYTGVTVIVRAGIPSGSSMKFKQITATFL